MPSGQSRTAIGRSRELFTLCGHHPVGLLCTYMGATDQGRCPRFRVPEVFPSPLLSVLVASMAFVCASLGPRKGPKL